MEKERCIILKRRFILSPRMSMSMNTASFVITQLWGTQLFMLRQTANVNGVKGITNITPIVKLPSALFQFETCWFYTNAALIFQCTQKNRCKKTEAIPPVSVSSLRFDTKVSVSTSLLSSPCLNTPMSAIRSNPDLGMYGVGCALSLQEGTLAHSAKGELRFCKREVSIK